MSYCSLTRQIRIDLFQLLRNKNHPSSDSVVLFGYGEKKNFEFWIMSNSCKGIEISFEWLREID